MDIGHRIIPDSIYSFLEFPATDSKFNPIDRSALRSTPPIARILPRGRGRTGLEKSRFEKFFEKRRFVVGRVPPSLAI